MSLIRTRATRMASRCCPEMTPRPDAALEENEVVVGAGTLVPPGKTLKSGYQYLGSPARQARSRCDKDTSYFHYTARKYAELSAEYLVKNQS